LHQAWRCLGDSKLLGEAGFKVVFENKMSDKLARNRSSALWLEEKKKPEWMFDTIFETTRSRSLTQQHYIASFPGKFAGLSSALNSQVQDTLQFCKRAWAAIQYCEARRFTFREVSVLWANVPFCENEVIREIFVKLDEHDFEWVSPYVQDDVELTFLMGTTLFNELGFNSLRGQISKVPNKKIGAQTAWKTLTDSPVFTGFGRLVPAPGEIKQTPLPTMPRRQYDALANDCTLPEIKDITNTVKNGWQSWSSLSKNVIPAAFSLMMNLSEDVVRLDQLPSAWHAVLAQRKQILCKPGSAFGIVVQEANRFGVLGKSVQILSRKGLEFISTAVEVDKEQWQPIVDHTHWQLCTLSRIPPIETLAVDKKPEIALQVVMRESVFRASARVGFRAVPVPYIYKLFELEVRSKKPDTPKPSEVLEAIVILIKTAIPDITDAEFHAALMCRIDPPTTKPIVTAASEIADSVFGKGDKATVRQEETNSKHRLEERASTEEKLRLGSKFLEMLGHKALMMPVTVVPKDLLAKLLSVSIVNLIGVGLDRHLVEELMPKVAGALYQPVLEKKSITTYYPGAVPASRSRSWGMAFTKEKVLRHCLQWQWSEHFKATGLSCPWSFKA
jgi:hypothetical protein